MIRHTVFIIAASLFLTACSAQPSSDQLTITQNTNSHESISLYESQNVVSSNTSLKIPVASGKGNIVLFPGTAVSYCDPTVSSDQYVYCTQPGCQHKTDDCGAYIGNSDCLAVYDGLWYYLRTGEDDSISLIRHDPLANERTVLKTYVSEEKDGILLHRIPQYSLISCGYIYISLTTTEYNMITNESSSTTELQEVDCRTGETRVLSSDDQIIDVIGGNEKEFAAFVLIGNPNENKREMRIYQRSDFSYETVVDTSAGLLGMNSIYANIANNRILYVVNDGLYCFDLETREHLKIADGTIQARSIFGNSVYFNRSDPKSDGVNSEFLRCTTDDFDLITMQNNDQKDVYVFSQYVGTETGFIGMSKDGKYGWISQKDFDQENYDGIVNF